MNNSENQIITNYRNESFLVMYHGILTKGRGIETLIKLVSVNPHIFGIVLGNGSEKYTENLISMAKEMNVDKRILFHPAVPAEQLWKYIGAVDLSIIMVQANSKSYYYALPNKFFESIQALTPMVTSNFPEMEKVIKQYKIGLTCDPENISEINRCVERMRCDVQFYKQCKANLNRAKEDLCWEREKKTLFDAYDERIKCTW